MNRTVQIAVVLSLLAVGFFGLMLITRVIAGSPDPQEHRPRPTSQE